MTEQLPGNGLKRPSSYFSFETQLITDHLLSVDSLLKLHRKTKQIDASIEERGALSTARTAWGEVRDNVERGTYQLICSKDIKCL